MGASALWQRLCAWRMDLQVPIPTNTAFQPEALSHFALARQLPDLVAPPQGGQQRHALECALAARARSDGEHPLTAQVIAEASRTLPGLETVQMDVLGALRALDVWAARLEVTRMN